MTAGFPDLEAFLPRLAAIPWLDAAGLEAEEIALLGRKSGVLTERSQGGGRHCRSRSASAMGLPSIN